MSKSEKIYKININAGTNCESIFQIGTAFHQKGELALAKNVYEKIPPNDPLYPESLHLVGVIYFQTNNYEEALKYFEASLKIEPKNAQVLNNLANLYINLDRQELALETYKKAIRIDPNFTEAFFNIANLQKKLGQLDEAAINYDQALRLRPIFPEAFLNKGNLLRDIGRTNEALEAYQNAISLNPKFAQAHYNLGLIFYKLERYDNSIAHLEHAIQIHPSFAEAHNSLSTSYIAINQTTNALKSASTAISINPNYIDAYNNRGLILKKLNRFTDSIKDFEFIIKLHPERPDAYFNLGNLHNELHNFGKALEYYDHAIKLNDNYAEAHWNKGLIYLLHEHYDLGWKLYEWRWKWEGFSKEKRVFLQPQWLGNENLEGKKILIHCEQGLGDCIQFSRYVSIVEELGATVIFETYKPLINLFQNLGSNFNLIERGKSLPDFDFHCPLLSLPLALFSIHPAIPKSQSYLKCHPEKLSFWNSRLKQVSRPRVGIVWNGNSLHKNDHNRSISADIFIQKLPNIFQYICLKNEVTKDESTLLDEANILNLSQEIEDFEDTAAICKCVDLVISVDTSVAHLAGAIGTPTWILLPYSPDWRWSVNKQTTPWYQSVKLYRQKTDRSWEKVLSEVANDLNKINIRNKF